ncbi:MAG: hypothetical protein WCV91_06650 [Candidatus Margulisiibacteriota bacterium]
MPLYKRAYAALIALLGVIFIFPLPALANKEEKSVYSKADLINQLKEMKRDPKKFNVVTAMCYEIAMLPETVVYQCTKCRKKTTYPYDSNSGKLIEKISSINYLFSRLPYKTAVDTTGFCPKCGKDKIIVVRSACFNCGKEFTYKIADQTEADKLKWLAVTPKNKEIDGNTLDIWTSEEARVKLGADYILEHIFCPECRKKIVL